MLTHDGRVKVLDFGLAKIAGEHADAASQTDVQTRDGMVMGTVPYMSPEQIAGRAVDHRTDLFSLGILLYEMAAGRRPFEGASSAEVTAAILRDTPPPLGEIRADLPADLVRITRRCLEKLPNDRVQTARDVCNELRDIGRQRALHAYRLSSRTRSSIRRRRARRPRARLATPSDASGSANCSPRPWRCARAGRGSLAVRRRRAWNRQDHAGRRLSRATRRRQARVHDRARPLLGAARGDAKRICRCSKPSPAS